MAEPHALGPGRPEPLVAELVTDPAELAAAARAKPGDRPSIDLGDVEVTIRFGFDFGSTGEPLLFRYRQGEDLIWNDGVLRRRG